MNNLLYHPHYNRKALEEHRQLLKQLGDSDGLDNRRSNMGRRWTDRRCYVREDDKLTPIEAYKENKFIFWWLVGILLLALSFSAYSCGDMTEPEPVEIKVTGAL